MGRFTAGLLSIVIFLALPALADKPRIHPEFPIRDGAQLSPPVVGKPIHECAKVVHVAGFVPHATVSIFANVNEKVGEAAPPFAFADIPLTRALKLGEKITATQTVQGLTSVHSYIPVEVTSYPAGGLNKPEVGKDIFQCGRIVPVDKLVESVKVRVFENGAPIGEAEAAGTWQPVFVQPLQAGSSVTAQQIACEDEADKTIKGPMSDPVTVKPEPQPLRTPRVDASTTIIGNDAVALYDLYVGSEVQVRDNANPVGGGFATATGNWCPISPPVHVGSSVTANQKLCGPPSPDSPPVKPTTELKAPQMLAPICAGSQFAVIRGTVVNANVILFRSGQMVGNAGAVAGDLVIALGGNAKWNAGDVVTARQYMGNLMSPVSNAVTVTAQLRVPAVEILGGEPFFLAEGGEQAIDGPVFPRGRGPGPLVAVQACCTENVKAEVRGPDGSTVAEVPLTEVFPGYFTGRWDWHSMSNWKVPDGIPVGPYTVRVTTSCNQEPETTKFYVIFNPANVSGPDRFSFNETGIWFGTLQNKSKALTYQLHPDDFRVFQKAIGAVKGEVDPLTAAQKVADAEEALFAYSLAYHTDDVLSMLASFNEAQCADDANVLVSMLRSVGIPAHPATADAALETGAANWTFDTWVEFLVRTGAGTEWLILHPHEYPNLPPKSRSDFGANQGVATKGFNDLVIMADENWVPSEVSDQSADVTYTRNSCQEPNQNHVSHAAWLIDLCEQGYWNPNHWDCAGIGTRSSPLRGEWRRERRDLTWGGALAGRFVLTNVSARAVRAALVIELVSDLMESKAFPDKVLARRHQAISLMPKGRTSVPFRFRIPPTAPPGYHFYLRAVRRIGKDAMSISVEPIELVPVVDVTLNIEGEPRVGAEFVVTAAVYNRSRRQANGVRVVLSLPTGLEAGEKQDLQMGSLKPGERRELTWRVHTLAPLEAGAVKVSVWTADAGWAQALHPIQIKDAPRERAEEVIRPQP